MDGDENELSLFSLKISECGGDELSSGDGPDGFIARNCENVSTFDSIIGHIEDILIDFSFQEMQKSFLEKYFMEFEDTDENKLSYMPIFEEYILLIENYLEEKLKLYFPDFNMELFTSELLTTQGSLEGDVFEMLYTLTDFLAFKDMILNYKAEKEGRSIDFSPSIMITPLQNAGVYGKPQF